ncbi:hypothetical protein X975_00758, partial [Stegodyphus mimosarum]
MYFFHNSWTGIKVENLVVCGSTLKMASLRCSLAFNKVFLFLCLTAVLLFLYLSKLKIYCLYSSTVIEDRGMVSFMKLLI